jgi:hypothetical protein
VPWVIAAYLGTGLPLLFAWVWDVAGVITGHVFFPGAVLRLTTSMWEPPIEV